MTITTTTTTIPISNALRSSLWRAGAIAGALAAATTTAVVVAARGAGIAVAVRGEAIPLAGFAQLTLVATLMGVVLAKVLSRRASQPRRTFTAVTMALTFVSLVPDALVDATVGSKMILMLTHAVAAAIVIPSLAARLSSPSNFV